MKEEEYYNRIKPELKLVGIPNRIENVAAMSVPDVALICPKYTIWLELKIIRSNKIYMQKYQNGLLSQWSSIMNDNLLWILAYEEKEDISYFFKYKYIKSNIKPYVEDKVFFYISDVTHTKTNQIAKFLGDKK